MTDGPSIRSTDPVVELCGVSVAHAAGTPWEARVLENIDLRFEAGDRVLIVGGNGSGKSTLLSVLAGLLRPTAGSCTIDGTPTHDAADRIGVVIQNTRLQLNRPTVSEELEDMAADGADLPRIVHGLGLATLLNRRIDELSGGQQRRVGLAGTLLRETDLILLDEPLAGLDEASTQGLLAALDLIPAESILVVVTHDLEASRPILRQGRGRILEIDGGRVSERERL